MTKGTCRGCPATIELEPRTRDWGVEYVPVVPKKSDYPHPGELHDGLTCSCVTGSAS